MIRVIGGIAAAVIYLAVFFMAAFLLPEKYRSESLSKTVFTGFGLYFSCFQIVALIFKVLKTSLRILSLTWIVVCLLVFLFLVIKRRNAVAGSVKNLLSALRREWKWLVPAAIVVSAVITVIVMNINHLTMYDYGYYVGTVTSSVETNTIELSDAYTGFFGNPQFAYYVLNTFTAHSAVLFQVFGLHPLIETNVTWSILGPLMMVFAVYKSGKLIFDDDKKKSFALVIVTLFAMYFLYNISASGMYFFFRPYEGKSLCNYLFPLIIITFFLAILSGEEKENAYAGIFFLALGGIAFTNTSLYLIPFLVAVLFIPYIIRERKLKTIFGMIVLMAPSVFWIAVHIIGGRLL